MEPIAIIGLGCLFPGAGSPAAFWDNLVAGRDTSSVATADEMGVDPSVFHHPEKGRRDRFYELRGGFVRGFRFDPAGYRLPAEQLSGLDPVFTWPIEVGRQALADSGHLGRPDALRRCGLVLGNLSFPTRASHRLRAPLYRRALETGLARALGPGADPRLDPLPGTGRTDPVNGLVSGYPAALAARALGLGGAHHALDAACASSFYALRLACDRLASGEAELMLAGAVSCADPFFIHMGFSIFQAYPQAGRSRPLDRRSGGLLSGEGAGMVALKRYADAVRDGDRVYAIVRGIGLSNDGAGRHPLVPNAAGQRLAFERAYRSAGLPPSGIQYVECHATGTPIGDVTELNAMEAFFGPHGPAPLIGSVKSNFGHLLTAAGMASLLKTTLSMHHGLIPPTLHVEEPVVSEGGLFGGETLVAKPTRWPDVPGPRRAGASAFGFGGTNAHVVIERPEPAGSAGTLPPRVETRARRAPRMSIVGMDAHFGRFDGIAALEAALYGSPPPEPPRPGRWNGLEAEPELLCELGLPAGAAPRGAYLEGFEIDFLRARIPPDSTDRPLPQQLLFLKVADGAIRDAGLERGANVAVIAAMGAEPALHRFRGRVDLGWQLPLLLEREGIALEPAERERLEERLKACIHDPAQLNQYVGFIGNIMACRVAVLWDFHGPAFTVSAEEGSVTRALEAAGSLLAAGEVEAVVVGAVELAGGPEAVLALAGAAAVDPDGGRGGHDRSGGGWMVGEGAGAIVLRRREDTERAGARVHAVVEAVAHAQSPSDGFVPGIAASPSAEAVAAAAREALAAAGVAPGELGYLEMCASGIAARDSAEARGLAEVYRADGPDPTCAAGSAKGTIGHPGAASGMAGLLHAALCLRGRYVAGFARWSGPRDPEVWERSAFFVPDAPRPWLVRRDERRLAGVSVLAADGVAAHVVLSEGTPPPPRATALDRLGPLRLLPIGAADADGLMRAVRELEGRIAGGAPLEEAAASLHAAYAAAGEAPLAVALLAGSAEEALRETRLAIRGIPEAIARGGGWETPTGSCFAARPVGREGEVAVVYPGAYSAYPGLGQDLLQIFPSLHDLETSRVADPARALSERWLHPRRMRPQSEAEREAAKRALRAEPVAMMQAAIGFGVLATAVLRDHLGVRPAAAFGYSMGESSMLWSMGVWRDAEAGGERLRRSPLFARRLAGACETAREYLGLPPGTRDFWSSWVVAAPAAAVRERLRREPRVFLAHVNTPGEVVISGATGDAERVVRDLGCEALPTNFTTAVHCEAIRAEEEALREFHRFETHDVPGVRFYGAAENAPTALERERLARNLARAVCQPVDFPRLVERVWSDGARVFVEPGPGAGCSRWIGEILSDRPHVVVPLDRRGVGDATSLLRAAARLVAHRVPLDLSALRPASREPAPAAAQPRSLVRTIPLGGRPMVPALEPEMVALLRSRRAPEPEPTPMPMPDPFPVRGSPRGRTAPAPAAYTPARHARLLTARIAELRGLPAPPAERPGPALAGRPGVVWDEAALREFAAGEIGRALGPEYAEIDRYRRRVRLPMPPYLLVTRVTRLDAERGRFRPSAMTTEYDVPRDAWYAVDGQVPIAVAVESGQCDLLLISYLGIDFECRGERVYRLLDCTLTFLGELPRQGDTLRYEIRIDSFARSGETLLFFFRYDCFAGERKILEMRGGCAGFFSDRELERGRGVVDSPADVAARAAAVPRDFAPPLRCGRRAFDRADLLRLARGELAECFGPAHHAGGRNPSLRLPDGPLLMLDRVAEVDPRGGAWGLGTLVAEKDLRPDDWYFPCHFRDDQVLAGSLMCEGCVQLLQFYLVYLGLHSHTFDARFQPVPGVSQSVVCRGQVTPESVKLVYRMEVTELGTTPRPFARANVDILLGEKVVVRFRDLAVQLSEKNPRLLPPAAAPRASAEVPLYTTRQVEEFATGSLEACFGPDCAVFEGRRVPRTPNGELQLISRVTRAEGTRREVRPGSWLESEYDVPLDAWFYRGNGYPTAPYSVLMEIGLQPCGFLSAHLGSSMADPEADLFFRNLDGSARLHREIDLRGRTVRNRVTLLSSTSVPGVIIQKFAYAMECEGTPFFEGEAVFGYFTGEALSRQLGLDRGERVPPWFRSAGPAAPQERMELGAGGPLFEAAPGRPHERLAGGQLHFLDHALWSAGGGLHGRGYIHAERSVELRDWFFACHFFMDPVMPGSLGVEAMLEALQAWTLASGLTRSFRSPRFGPAEEHGTAWKYRGQIVEGVKTMSLEVHVARVDRDAAGLTVVADASLWGDGLRIYEVRGLAVRVTEAGA